MKASQRGWQRHWAWRRSWTFTSCEEGQGREDKNREAAVWVGQQRGREGPEGTGQVRG